MSFLEKVWAKVARKAVYALATIIFAGIKVKWPEAPLPEVDLVVDLGFALLATHTLTDVVAILKAAVVEYLHGRKAPELGPGS